MKRCPAADQLKEYKATQMGGSVLTDSHGCPVASLTASLTAGSRGPVLLQDLNLIDELSHFDKERIPERVAHAKGAGAFGYFEVTNDITRLTKLSVFSKIGKRTPVAVRFSTSAGESGSADTVRDIRGFAVKFYSEEGNWDVVGNNSPIFFIRDPILFPSFVHSQKRNPATHLKDPDMFWDFISLRPETTHQVIFFFSDRGTPDGYRHMNGYGSHTFKLINDKNEAFYCKFHYKTDQGIKNLTAERAASLCATDPDYATRDLYDSIATRLYPVWTWHIQYMTLEQAAKWYFNPFDLTKAWPHKEFPLIPIGKMVLDRNPKNYFAEVEQLSFSPANLIPGIAPSNDKVLQARMFAYNDAASHRLGSNFRHIPVNRPYRSNVANYQRDGKMCYACNQEGAPNYYPNSFNGPTLSQKASNLSYTEVGTAARYDTYDEDNFTQAGVFWRVVLNNGERSRLIENILESLKKASEVIQERAIRNFKQVDLELGQRLTEGLQKKLSGKLRS